jgi:glucokinase
VVENDANAAAFAEAAMGSAAGSADVLMVTVGTGLGSGLVLGGELYRGHHGFAGEAGHMTVVVDGRPCPCGSRGCWERYASGTALVAQYLERGGDPELDGPAIGRLAAGGDAVAEAALTDVGEWLGRGLASLVAVLDPEVIVVGGGVSESGNRLLEPARHHMRANLTGADRRPAPEIRQAALGNDAGVIGAAMLASQR